MRGGKSIPVGEDGTAVRLATFSAQWFYIWLLLSNNNSNSNNNINYNIASIVKL
jgi:hypothetical protein